MFVVRKKEKEKENYATLIMILVWEDDKIIIKNWFLKTL